MNIKVIAFVGMPGSGKGTCSDYLHEKYGWPIIHFGNMYYEEMQKLGLDNVKDENWFRPKLRREHGKEVLAKLVAKRVKELIAEGKSKIVLDGLYSWSEYRYLEETFGDKLLVIAITAPKKDRRHRVLDRKDSHRKYTLKQLITREVAEIEDLEKGGPIAYADYTIVNDMGLDEMLAKLEVILGIS